MTDLRELFDHHGLTDDTVLVAPCCGRLSRLGDPPDPNRQTRLCRNRCCVQVLCPCGAQDFAYGPAGCQCEAGGPNPGAGWRHRRLRGERK